MLDLAALALVAAEWLAIGFGSGIDWPGETSWAPRWALRLLSGAFLVGLAQLLLALLGIGFASVPLVLLLAAALGILVRSAAGLAAVGREPVDPAAAPPSRAASFVTPEPLVWLLLALLLGAAMVRAWLVPEAGWDAFSHWGLKAQAFALNGTIVDAGTVHEYYPPLVPLLEAWLTLHRGQVAIDFMKLVWPLVGAAFALSLAWHLRMQLGPTWLAPAFALGILLGTTQLLESFWTGQADLALTAYLTLSTLAAWQYLRTSDRGWLVHVALFGAAASLTKYEGLPRVGVVVLALLIESALARCRRHAVPAVVLGASAAVAYAPWVAFRLLHGIPGNSEHISQLQPAALGTVIVTIVAVLGGVRTGGGVLVALLGYALAARNLFTPPYRVLTLVILGQAAATILAFLISETPADVQVRTSATRLIEQFLPVALFASALWLSSAIRPLPRSSPLVPRTSPRQPS